MLLLPYQRIVPKLKYILFDLHKYMIACKGHTCIAIFLRSVKDLQNNKQGFSILVH